MTITLGVPWQDHAAELDATLAKLGKLTDPAWRAAVRGVPRHAFVPTYYVRDSSGWTASDTSSEASRQKWLDDVYSNKALITAVHDVAGSSPQVLSSSSQPGLMTRMLESLDVDDGHRVLEIGTGTGYNAALLSHRLGGRKVFSVDVESELVDLARSRLAALGYRPTLVAADGALGLPQYGPYDRIIATCAVPRIPWTWVEQVPIGGVVLCDIKIAQNAGSLVRLTRTGFDRAQGRFDPTYAAFMSLRSGQPDQAITWKPRTGHASRQFTTTVDPQTPWKSLVVWFLAAMSLGPDISLGFTGDGTTAPASVSMSTPDGSWTQISTESAHGAFAVMEGGPRRLWSMVEAAERLWTELGRPGWNRFGMTVTENGDQVVWHEDPASGHTWHLAEAPRRAV